MQPGAKVNTDLCTADQCFSHDVWEGLKDPASQFAIKPDKKMLDLKDKLRIFT